MAVVAASAVTLSTAGIGCGDESSADKGDDHAKGQIPYKETVTITKSGFHPKDARIMVGGSITWVNRDGKTLHTAETRPTPPDAKSDPNFEKTSFDTHALTWREPYTVDFHKPGTFNYFSSYDAYKGGNWKGTVSVIYAIPPRRQ